MPSTFGQSASPRKQIQPIDSVCVEARRLEGLQKGLLAIAEDAGFPISYLSKPGAWYEASRNPEEYDPSRPYIKEQGMIRDLVSTVARIGTAEQRDKVRRAVQRYFELRCEDALEMIGSESEADLVALTVESEREIGEARCATILALSNQTPELLDVAEQENREAENMIDVLGRSLRLTARRARLGQPKLPLRWLK